MDRTVRIILFLLFVVVTIVRLVAQSRGRGAKRPQPTAAPPRAGVAAPPLMRPPAPAAATVSPIDAEPVPRAGGFAATAVGLLVWAAGNAVLWLVLLGLPALAEVPILWRLVAGVIANLLLIRVARIAAARIGSRSLQSAGDDRNPIR